MPTPASILKDTFGYDTFRPLQREVIENVLAHKDTLAIMPTGGGKSLCYQIPALLLSGLTVVVSPLIALMKDQVEQLRAAGVPALFLNSSLDPQSYVENMEYVANRAVRLLYVAPETLLTPRLFALLDSVKVDLVVIDEAHCISEWGHDFRPEYCQLVDVRHRFPQAVCLALTATATPRVRADIKTSLGFKTSNEFIASFNRENLYIEVNPKSDPVNQTLRFLERFKDQSGIIYCFTRRQVDELAAYLAQQGYSALPYHAGLEDGERRRNQEAFIRDDAQIIVATIAFGMGINKPNVRFILHYDLPKSIENYYQEIGRAGRDGLPAHCLLLYNYGDAAKLRFFIDQKEDLERQVALKHLNAITRYAEDETTCRRKPLLEYFGENYTAPTCSNCDNCNAEPVALEDITIPVQMFLSCVKRTGERFGAKHVVDVLRGSHNQKVLTNGHDKLSTYAIGVGMNEKQWIHLAHQLVKLGYLNQNGEYPTLSLTEKAVEALKKRSKIMGQLQPVQNRRSSRKERQTGPEYDQALFALLRQQRKELADASGVPSYVIFSDRTLAEMASYLPQSPVSLLKISGVGEVKLRKYGEIFLAIIQPYCLQHNLTERFPSPSGRGGQQPTLLGGETEPALGINTSGQRYLFVGEAYNTGETVQGLMARYGVTAGTILDHLVHYLAAGKRLRDGADLQALSSASPEERKDAFTAFTELGVSLLKPVFEMLEGRVDYEELKILRLLYLVAEQE